MKYRFVILFIFLLSGCTTVEFVRKDTAPIRQGILRHSPPSNPEKEAKYRAEVNKKANEFCGGDFAVTKEYQALDESRSTAGIGTGFGMGMGGRSSIFMGTSGPDRTMYSFVEFTCK